MILLAYILLIIGILQLYITFTADDNQLIVETIDKRYNLPINVDPNFVRLFNGLIGIVETLCALYIILR